MLWSSDLGAGSLRTLLPPSQPPSPAGRGVLTPAQASGANRRGLGSPTWAPSAGATLQRFHKTREGFGLYHQILFTLWTRQKYRHLKTVQTRHVKYTPKDALSFEFIKCQSNSYYLKETVDCLKKRMYYLFLVHFALKCVKICMTII